MAERDILNVKQVYDAKGSFKRGYRDEISSESAVDLVIKEGVIGHIALRQISGDGAVIKDFSNGKIVFELKEPLSAGEKLEDKYQIAYAGYDEPAYSRAASSQSYIALIDTDKKVHARLGLSISDPIGDSLSESNFKGKIFVRDPQTHVDKPLEISVTYEPKSWFPWSEKNKPYKDFVSVTSGVVTPSHTAQPAANSAATPGKTTEGVMVPAELIEKSDIKIPVTSLKQPAGAAMMPKLGEGNVEIPADVLLAFSKLDTNSLPLTEAQRNALKAAEVKAREVAAQGKAKE